MDELPINIKRVDKADDSGKITRGFKVQIWAGGKRVVKFFNDKKYNGEQGGRKASLTYLDEICRIHNINLEDRIPNCDLIGISETEYQDKGANSSKRVWQATWRSPITGKQVTERFPVTKYGEEKAKQLAIDARAHALDSIERGRDPIFKGPKNKNSKLWRYMDFTKFVSMLEHAGVFFAQADILGDPFEGSYSRGNSKNRKFVYSRKKESSTPVEDLTAEIKQKRKNIMISCWHHSNYESAAMWKLYAKSNEAVCVQTTYKKLESCINEAANIGLVKYIDYERNWISENSYYYPFIYKRKSFEHEKEVRAIIDLNEISQLNFNNDAGYWQDIDLNHLIIKVFVAPDSPEWFFDLTKSICLKYNVKCEVIKSPLDDSPIY